VVGTIHPQRIISNSGAKPKDSLILTKPLGTGIITTGIKKGLVDDDVIKKVVGIMASLNKNASESMLQVGVSACTDVTGFGLMGHLCELVQTSKVGAKIFLSKVPTIEPASNLAKEKIVPGGTLANLKFVNEHMDWDAGITDEEKLILCDAQTSGGLLISVPKEREAKLLESLLSHGVEDAKIIGEITEDVKCRIQVKR
jgi:selenide,water dikinase